jgi:glycosyltransferase involved in cell wall biosynthesis
LSNAQEPDGRRLQRSSVSVVIPCLDEEAAIGPCVEAVRAHGVGEVIVVDGGSTDRTVERAAAAGARTVVERRRGYGRAMLAGIATISPEAAIVLFIDGDGSDRTEMIPAVLAPIEQGAADFVLGSRLRGPREPGSLAPAQVLAGHLAGLLLRLRYGVRFTDMSPFRAIRREALDRLGMRDETYGWTLEMQIRVAAACLRSVEVPVGQRRRAGGVSKVSGDLRTAVRVAWVLTATFLRLAMPDRMRGAGARGRG